MRRCAVAEDCRALANRLRAIRASREMRAATDRGASACLRVEKDRVAARAGVASGGGRRARARTARVHQARIRRRTREAGAATRATHPGARGASGTPDLIGWAEGGAAASPRPARPAGDSARPAATAAACGAARRTAGAPPPPSALSGVTVPQPTTASPSKTMPCALIVPRPLQHLSCHGPSRHAARGSRRARTSGFSGRGVVTSQQFEADGPGTPR